MQAMPNIELHCHFEGTLTSNSLLHRIRIYEQESWLCDYDKLIHHVVFHMVDPFPFIVADLKKLTLSIHKASFFHHLLNKVLKENLRLLE